MKRRTITQNSNNHTRVTNAQCTCNLKPWPDGPDWNPHCPKHGLDALLAQADPSLDIDTSYQREERS